MNDNGAKLGAVYMSRETKVVVAIVGETDVQWIGRIVRPGINDRRRQGETVRIYKDAPRKSAKFANNWLLLQEEIAT